MQPTAGYATVLRNRNFLVLWGNQIIQQFAFGLLNFSLVLLVYKLTQSNLAVALIFFAFATPVFLFGIFAGVVADIADRKRIIMLANLGMAIAISLLLVAQGKLFLILAVAFLISAINQFFIPTESASIPMIVEKNELITANSLFTITLFVAQISGLTVAGPAVLFLGFNLIFIILTLLLLTAFLLVQFLPRLIPAETPFSRFGKQKWPDLVIESLEAALHRIAAGLKFIATRRKVALGVFNLGLMEGLLAMLAVLSVGYIKETVASDPTLLAVILVPPAGVGFAGSALFMGRLNKFFRKEVLALTGIFGMGLSLLFLSFLPRVVVLTAGRDAAIGLIAGLGFFVGAFAVAVTVPSRTLVQELTPIDMLGRVFSVLAILTAIGASMPILLASSLADVFGVELVLGVIGILVFLAGLAISKPLLSK